MIKDFKDILASTPGLSLEEKLKNLRGVLGSKLDDCLKLVKQNRVRKYVFKPSSRAVWVVAGREGVYEVLPEAPYCSCEDFYFRVLNGEKQLCYHLVAQGLAEAMGRYVVEERDDCLYDEFMSTFRRLRHLGKPRDYVRYRDKVRNMVEAILKNGPMKAKELHREILAMGFKIPSVKSLTGFLTNDPKRRFVCEKGLWALRK